MAPDMIMDFFLNVSPILRILLVFFLILLASRMCVPLGIALVLGGVMIDWWAGKPLFGIGSDFIFSFSKPEFWLLVINITLILEFGYFMAYEPNSKAILSASRRLGGKHGRALSIVLIPAAIGLVPMPGGALFSAPLVGEAVQEKNVPAEWKVAVNYWFRHIFEYWWPLYPVVIVSLSIFSLKTWQFFALQIPFTIISLIAGWVFLMRHRIDLLVDDIQPESEKSKRLPLVLLPILFVVFCTLMLPGFIKYVLPVANPTTVKLLAMSVGLVISLGIIWVVSRRDVNFRLFQNVFSDKTANVVFTLGGVMIFQTMLDASGLLPLAGKQLSDSMVPLEIVIAFLPFLAGLVTGIAIGFAGPAFPLVVGLMAFDPNLSQASVLVLAFSMGYAGMMLSPVHLCYILTRRYFISGLFQSYKYIFPCVLAVALWGVIMHVFLRLVGW